MRTYLIDCECGEQIAAPGGSAAACSSFAVLILLHQGIILCRIIGAVLPYYSAVYGSASLTLKGMATVIRMARLVMFAAFLVGTFAGAYGQWELQTFNTTADLRGIHSIGNGVAWASGTNGTVLRTEDGGYVWQTCTVPPGAEKLDFRGIQGFDANTAIVMSSGKGDLSRLYKTTDGCHSWKLIFANPDKDGFWDAILLNRFDKDGELLGDPVNGQFALWETSDQGATWA